MTAAAQARAAEKVVEAQSKLVSAVEALVTGDDWLAAMKFAAQFRSRSFRNSMLIWVQHEQAHEAGLVPNPAPTLVAGYRQWQALGRQVDKGQPGYMILAPVTGRFAKRGGSWERMGRGEKPAFGEEVQSRLIGSRVAYVWDVSQTSGDPIPSKPEPVLLSGEAPAGLWKGLAAQVGAAGFTMIDPPADRPPSMHGLTHFVDRTVWVSEDLSPAARVSTLTHELAHVLMHDLTDDAVREHRGIREVEAESVAAVVLAAHGMDTSSESVPYVAGWADSVDATPAQKVVEQTGARVLSTSTKILAGLDTPQISDGDPPGIGQVREAQREQGPRSRPTASRRVEPAVGAGQPRTVPADRDHQVVPW